jgi:ABC-type lipoprotein export system ATPase subunit
MDVDNLSYFVVNDTKRSKAKCLLDAMSVRFEAGVVTAIMGPSGSGYAPHIKIMHVCLRTYTHI